MTLVEVAFVSVPHVLPEQPLPDSVHVTPLLAESLLTVAVKFCVEPVETLAVEGDTATLIAAPAMVIVAEDDFVVSETDVAISVTVADDGTEFGAL